MALLAPRAALAALALGLAGCSHSLAPGVDRDGTVRLHHRAPPGTPVWLVGDWNGWQPGPDPMTHASGDRYDAVIHLPPGVYAYAYAEGLPDGGVQIVTPEAAPGYVDDDLGSRDGVIRVGQAQ